MRGDRRAAGLGIDAEIAVVAAVASWCAFAALIALIGAFAYSWMIYWGWAALALLDAVLISIRRTREWALIGSLVLGVASVTGSVIMIAIERWVASALLLVVAPAVAAAASALVLYRARPSS
jgi:hypothetical protein